MLKFEPFVLHVQCRQLQDAQVLVKFGASDLQWAVGAAVGVFGSTLTQSGGCRNWPLRDPGPWQVGPLPPGLLALSGAGLHSLVFLCLGNPMKMAHDMRSSRFLVPVI